MENWTTALAVAVETGVMVKVVDVFVVPILVVTVVERRIVLLTVSWTVNWDVDVSHEVWVMVSDKTFV